MSTVLKKRNEQPRFEDDFEDLTDDSEYDGGSRTSNSGTDNNDKLISSIISKHLQQQPLFQQHQQHQYPYHELDSDDNVSEISYNSFMGEELNLPPLSSRLVSEIIHFSALGELERVEQVINRIKTEHRHISVKSIINSLDDAGNTALHWACYRKHFHVVKYLVGIGADPDIPNISEQQTSFDWACVAGDLPTIHFLYESGQADIYHRDQRGLNSLLLSIHHTDINVVRFLLHIGMPVSSKDDEGHTALHWASFSGNLKLIRLLLKKGADINCTDNLGRTPIHWAGYKGYTECTKALYEEGANIHLKDVDDKTPYQLALTRSTPPCLKYLEWAQKESYLPTGYQFKQGEYNYFWIFLALLGNLGFFYILYSFQYYYSIPIVIVCGNFARIILAHLWGDYATNPLPVTWWIIGCSICYWTYFFQILWNVPEYVFSHIFVTLSSLVFIYLLVTLPFSDPGIVKSTPQEDLDEFIECLKCQKFTPEVCPTCLIHKPVRAKHCKFCKSCVARYDHHCIWINNCVGAKNHRRFVLCLILYNIIAIPVYYVTFKYLSLDPNGPNILDCENYYTALMYYYDNYRMITIFFVYGLLAWIWILKLLSAQILGIFFNCTVNEVVNITRYTHLRSNGRWNIFNRGLFNNIKEFLIEHDKWSNTFHLEISSDSSSSSDKNTTTATTTAATSKSPGLKEQQKYKSKPLVPTTITHRASSLMD
ncbi:hypothetical protein CYY_000504 [Polysphondylium violaceum]|uniref:Palmitoyltransferase n=1 Tax=Polysphondylium violaceum TaxID=133409 RepID=A0A8J4Q3K1_9MYCE|nr:hypothetical protein CYY_000504 [Polysphondylium violaceum]